MDEGFIGKRELADEFDCTPQHINYLLRRGVLMEPMRLGRQRTMLWKRSDLDRLREQYDNRNKLTGNPNLQKKPSG